ncbi:site-2 protease family protein [Pseudobdellovibrio exovorus]|uniref:Putative Zn-dependent protease n=1 Tax=Pseudobdellovibrio exovorus JSS TaxID=1184267 RepID=M4VQX2_9BACT|nr:site-2 protease family protein [Pseudobdellovibrio exovorus]AGH95554.1 putative Zn-dependent protease [Pseudobdellovibrio exovorus JSS]
MDLVEIGGKLALLYVPFLFALCFHEFAHGLVAKWRGDNTAEQLGRLTLNPMAHADMVGTVLLPMAAIIFKLPIFFGWAKPVPVNPRNLKNVRSDMFWIAIAGPASNVLLAILATVFMFFAIRYGFLGSYSRYVFEIAQTFVLINLFLAIFNMLPIHPLDGGKVLARFLPPSLNYKLEQNEHLSGIILMVLIFTGMLKILSIPVFASFRFLMSFAGAA